MEINVFQCGECDVFLFGKMFYNMIYFLFRLK